MTTLLVSVLLGWQTSPRASWRVLCLVPHCCQWRLWIRIKDQTDRSSTSSWTCLVETISDLKTHLQVTQKHVCISGGEFLITPCYITLFSLNCGLSISHAGKIVANRTVDFEQVQWLNFTVRAQDHGSPPRFTELPVYLRIIDVNDNNPVFQQPLYQVCQHRPE